MTKPQHDVGAIVITRKEYDAFTSARALYEAEYEGRDIPPGVRAEFQHLSDVGIKIARALAD